MSFHVFTYKPIHTLTVVTVRRNSACVLNCSVFYDLVLPYTPRILTAMLYGASSMLNMYYSTICEPVRSRYE
jgi:hypothetical protein